MKESAPFKYDVRVRERMLKKGLLTESDLERHLASLVDREAACELLPLEQPALGRHEAAPRSGESNGADAPRAGSIDDPEEET